MSNKQHMVLGVDGGGTSTTAIVARVTDGEIDVLARGHSGPANPNAIGWDAAINALTRAVRQATETAEVRQFEAACFSVAGCGRPDEQARLMEWLESCGFAEMYIAVDDGQTILRAGTPNGVGVAVIAGTGSFVFGRNRLDQTARAGGWGYKLGDEGSGYALGLEGLKAVAQATDTVGPPTELTELIMGVCSVSEPAELIPLVYSADFTREKIASLAPVVLEVADRGDEVALSIVWRQLHLLERQARAVVSRLDLQDTEYHLAVGGGILINNQKYRDRLLAELQLPTDRVGVVGEPALGAVLLAADIAG